MTINRSTEPITPRLGRWSLALQEYDLEIVHSPGSKMAHVDALSRPPGLQLMDVEEGEQEKRQVKAIQDDGAIVVEDEIKLEDRKRENRREGTNKELVELYVVPEEMKTMLLEAHHSSVFAGHFGGEK